MCFESHQLILTYTEQSSWCFVWLSQPAAQARDPARLKCWTRDKPTFGIHPNYDGSGTKKSPHRTQAQRIAYKLGRRPECRCKCRREEEAEAAEDIKIVEDREEEEEEVIEAAGVEAEEEIEEEEDPLEVVEEEIEAEVLLEAGEVEGRLKCFREHQHSHHTPQSWNHNHSSQRPPSVPGGIPAPDKTVTKTEDALIAPTKSLDLSSLGLGDVLPRRPAYGTKGAEVTLWANYVSLTASSKLVLYRYEISVTPAAAGKKLTQVVRLLLEAPELAEYKHDLVSDFRTIILSRQKFDDRTINIAYRSIGEDEPKENGLQYQVKLQLSNTLATSELIEYLTSTNPSAQYDEKLPLIQALNIFLNHYAKSADNLVSMGSSSGSSKTFAIGQLSETWDLGSCLTAIRGFFASVRAATARVLVNINVSQAAFFQEGPLDQFILRLGTQGGLYKLQTLIKGIRVRVTHLQDRLNRRGEPVSRVKTIWCLANKNDGQGLQNPPRVKAFGAGPKDVEFWLKEDPKDKKKQGGKGAKSEGGQYISVYDFFAKSEPPTMPRLFMHLPLANIITEYKIHIQDTRLPVINVGDRENPNYFPLQVCYVLPGQPCNTMLSAPQAQQMIRFAVRKPFDNATSIVTKGLKTAGLSSETNPLLVSSCRDSDMVIRMTGLLIPPRVNLESTFLRTSLPCRAALSPAQKLHTARTDKFPRWGAVGTCYQGTLRASNSPTPAVCRSGLVSTLRCPTTILTPKHSPVQA